MTKLWISLIILMVFVSDNVSSNACNQVEHLNGLSGSFFSPNFPNDFPSFSICRWNVTVPHRFTVKLTFHSFTLEPGDLLNCTGARGSRVILRNVASADKTLLSQCGRTVPDPVFSIGRWMELRLVTGLSRQPGFNVSFKALSENELCPSSMAPLTDDTGNFTSPFYPRPYPGAKTCTWRINAPKGKHIKLILSDINIKESQGNICACDFLEIRNGSSTDGTTGNVCRNASMRIFFSTLDSLWVRFRKDQESRKKYKGFKAQYWIIDYTPPTCPREAVPLFGQGAFSSPNYPSDNYPANKDCSWLITVPSGNRLKIVFNIFIFEDCHDCNTGNCGHVAVYGGPSTTSPLLGKFCGTSVPEPKISSGGVMLVMFHSAFSRRPGFQANYSMTLEEPSPTVTLQIGSGSKPRGGKVLIYLICFQVLIMPLTRTTSVIHLNFHES